MIDTTVLVALTRPMRSARRQAAAQFLAPGIRAGQTLYTSRINEAEFRVGPAPTASPASETSKVNDVLEGLVILEFDSVCARVFAVAKAHLLDTGRPSGDLDVLIAAVALRNRQTLITRNPVHFRFVPGLVVETY